MGQEVTTTGTNEVAAHERTNRVAHLYGSIQRDAHYRDTLPAPLVPGVRRELEAYRKELHARLRPISMADAERTSARQAIGVLLQSYVNTKTGNPAATLDAYVAMLRDQPVWAIMAALDDFRLGRVYDLNAVGDKVPFTLDHAPSAIRILGQVKKHTDAVEEERGRVVRLLSITHYLPAPVSDAERDKVAALMSGLASDMAMKNAVHRKAQEQKTRAEADAARERAKRITEDARKRRRADDIASQDRAAAEAHAG